MHRKLAPKFDLTQISLLVFSIALAALFLLAPRLNSLAYGGIDPSFNYGINAAADSEKAFGTDFIATYGPLNFLITNYLPQDVLHVTIALAFYVLILGIGAYIFARLYLVKPRRMLLGIPIMLYTLAITNGGGSIEWNYLTAFLMYCFILLKVSGWQRTTLICALAVFAALFSLTKFTLGFASLLTLLMVCSLSLHEKIVNKVIYCSTAVGVFLLFFFSLGHHLGITSFVEYVKTALIESGNFSSAMSAYDKQTFMATAFIAVACAILVLWPLLHKRDLLIKYAFILPALLIVWKYSVARQDAHMLRFLQISLPLTVLLYYSFKNRQNRDRWIAVSVVALSFMAMFANKIPFYGQNSFYAAITSPAANIVQHGFISYFNIPGQKDQWAKQSALGLQDAALPSTMTSTIGREGVDIFPWEASIVAANNLKWQNRPSPFSFETYDPELDNLNASFFESKKAPKFIIWHNTGNGMYGVDFRNILWDEPATLRSILANYTVKESNSQFMLLQRQPKSASLDSTYFNLPDPLLPSSEWTSVPATQKANQLQFMRFSVNETLINKAEVQLLRGHTFYLHLKTNKDNTYIYRFVMENSQQGFLVNDLPFSWQELVYFMQHHRLESDEQVESFRMSLST